MQTAKAKKGSGPGDPLAGTIFDVVQTPIQRAIDDYITGQQLQLVLPELPSEYHEHIKQPEGTSIRHPIQAAFCDDIVALFAPQHDAMAEKFIPTMNMVPNAIQDIFIEKGLFWKKRQTKQR